MTARVLVVQPKKQPPSCSLRPFQREHIKEKFITGSGVGRRLRLSTSLPHSLAFTPPGKAGAEGSEGPSAWGLFFSHPLLVPLVTV